MRRSFGAAGESNATPQQSQALTDLVELNNNLSKIEQIVKKHGSRFLKAQQVDAVSRKSQNSSLENKESIKKDSIPGPSERVERSSSQKSDDIVRPQYQLRPQLLRLDYGEEEELVELIRRTSELVVRGEKSAAALATRRLRRTASSDSLKNDDTQVESETEEKSYLALFETFHERNTLALLVNIVTGKAFSPKLKTKDDTEMKKEKEEFTTVMLPSVSVATQSVQSISMLLQNVSNVTSLYLLLSNHHVNDLINFPLEVYDTALREEINADRDKKNDGETGNKEKQNFERIGESLAETAELTTHFVSFLKSLAMRMNAETLQFFLEYPPEMKGTSKQPHFKATDSSVAPWVTLPTEKDNNDINTMAKDISSALNVEVDFPLYAVALKYCSANEDSFVRVTAMNICLNTLRLVTVSSQPFPQTDEEKSVCEHNSVSTGSSKKSNTREANVKIPPSSVFKTSKGDSTSNQILKNYIKSPSPKQREIHAASGMLGSIDLPFRERLAIAHHVCSPLRVEGLAGPIFIKLAHLCGSLEDVIQSIDNFVVTSSDEKIEVRKRRKLVNKLNEITASLQDELLLLDDLLKVGLCALNEQVIEFMLASFVYPLLLQPLRLCVRYGSTKDGQNDVGKSNAMRSSSARPDLVSNNVLSSRPNHPFSVDSVSSSLLHSGLLGDDLSVDEKLNTSNCEADDDHIEITHPATAKTALFGLFTIFNTMTNQPLLRLLFAAFFHPLAPDATRGEIITSMPVVLFVKDDKICIKIDSLLSLSEDYNFGSCNKEGSDPINEGRDVCVFLLSPALANILRYDEGGGRTLTRENPYRRIILDCIAGNDGMRLQQLSVLAVDAAISALSDGASDILFGTSFKHKELGNKADAQVDKIVPTSSENGSLFKDQDQSPLSISVPSEHVVEVVASLCVSVMTSSVCISGVWRLDYDRIATNALLGAIAGNKCAQNTACRLIEQRRLKSASFLTQLPSLVDTACLDSIKSGLNGGPLSIMEGTDEQQLDIIMDRIVRDEFGEEGYCILDKLVRFENGNKTNFMIDIATRGKPKDISNHLCKALSPNSPSPFDEGKAAAQNCASSSTLAHFYLDSLSTLLSQNVSKGHTYFHQCTDTNSRDITWTMGQDDASTSILSNPLCIAMYDEREERNAESSSPKPGAVVGLVGRVAFPCVCEVSEECATLFTDERACVIADGVKWQSLYLVLLGRYLLLAEPEKGGTGGNGMIVTACQLSCLSVEKDSTSPAAVSSPARRLLLLHSSLDKDPPGVFTLIEENSSSGAFVRSHMELWFEDNNSAHYAFEAITAKIRKARARRGHRFRESFLRMSSHNK